MLIFAIDRYIALDNSVVISGCFDLEEQLRASDSVPNTVDFKTDQVMILIDK